MLYRTSILGLLEPVASKGKNTVKQSRRLSAVKRVIFPALIVSALALSSSVASADTTFNFTYVDTATNGNNIDTVGQLTAQLVSGNEYLITGITGTRNGVGITAFLGAGTHDDFDIDDLLFVPPDSPNGNLSNTFTSGFGFTAGGQDFNPYFDPNSGNTFEYVGLSGSIPGTQIALTVSATPEPSYYLPIGVGMAALVFVKSRRRRA
jgi:hypothetical protein